MFQIEIFASILFKVMETKGVIYFGDKCDL
jgi:hypothetical protein